MDSIKGKKVQAMKKYRKIQFLPNNVLFHLLAGLTCSLYFSNPFWLPSLCSSMKQFLLISLPCIWSSFFNPKCLFVVVNVIVIFLVGESGLVGRNTSRPARDIYDEYMQRSRSLRGFSVSAPQEKIRQPSPPPPPPLEDLKPVDTAEEDYKEVDSKEENQELVETKEVITAEDKEPKHEEETSEIVEEEEEEEEAYHVEHGEREITEEVELPAEELNKRVEEFIARVNKQRWLEAQLLVCCKA